VGAIEGAVGVRPERIGAERNVVAGQKPGLAGEQRNAEFGAEPAGKPDMIRMMMGNDESRQFAALQCAIEQGPPSLPGAVVGDACIDRRIAVAVLDKKDVHMVELKGQLQPCPENAGCGLDTFTR
jgi:hypothetical protein